MTFKQFVEEFLGMDDYNVDGGQIYQEDGRTALHLAVLKNDQAMV